MARFPRALLRLLEDARVWKVGIGVLNDATKLRRDYGVCCRALLDVGDLARRVLAEGERTWSLSDLCARLDGKRLRKDRALRCADWEGRLDAEAVQYAALDAWAGLHACHRLCLLEPPRARPVPRHGLSCAGPGSGEAPSGPAAPRQTAEEIAKSLLVDIPPDTGPLTSES